MGLEQRINQQLNKYPGIKKGIKRVYQRAMYAISPKIKSEGDIERISPDDPKHEYFFGYYDKSPEDETGRYVLCLKAENTWSDVAPSTPAQILLIDTSKPESDPARVKEIAVTHTWNVQQGCMMQWLGPDFDHEIIYNDFRDGKYISVVLDVFSGEERVLAMPVYSVAADGSFALTLDFSRLHRLRPGYGYSNLPEETADQKIPDSTAIWKLDIKTNTVTPVLPYTAFSGFEPRPEMKNAEHKVNHIMLSPSGTRFMVLHRWFDGQRKYTRLVTVNVDGTEMFNLSDDDMVSHCYWKNDEEIIAFENKKGQGAGYYLMRDRTTEFTRLWPEMTADGHPSYSPDGSLVITDTYPNRSRLASLIVMDDNRVTQLVKVFAPFKYDNDTRCDLHPRWSRDGKSVYFDSVYEGHRGLHKASVPQKVKTEDINKKISVIIPVYNVEKYVERCVESVLCQTYRNIEIIIVNDGSTDSSLAICQRLQKEHPEISIIDKSNGGLSSARNAGIKVAHGDYIAFLDSDDWVSSDCYEYMLNLAIANDADLSDIMIYQVRSDSDNIPNDPEKIKIYSGRDILEHYMYRGMSEQNGAPYSACRKLYRRDLFMDDTAEFVEGTVNEDICFNYRILRKCSRIVVSNQVKYFYFQGRESITTGSMKKKDLALLTVSRELVKLCEESGDEKIIELAKMKEARSDFSLLARAARDGIDETSIDNSNELVQGLRKRLKKNLGLLLKSPMSSLRKVLAVAFVTNYDMSCKIVKALHL